jgi:hypothetical protein
MTLGVWTLVNNGVCLILEPGGFIEWDERDQMSSRVAPGPSGETKAMERLVGLALNFAKGNSENSAAYIPAHPLSPSLPPPLNSLA